MVASFEITTAIVVSMLSLGLSAFNSYRGNKKTDTKDIEERAKNNAEINFKLDNIGQTTNEIRREITSMREDIQKHNDRIIKVEESCKQAHHRLNTIEDRLNIRGGEDK